MFGNKEGWILSAVIVGLMSWMLLKIGRLEPMSEPSGQFTHLHEPIRLPVAPEEALPGVMTEDRDAGEQYWQAIELYRKFPAGYRTFNPKELDNISRLPALNLLIEAASAKRASLFINRPQLLVNYKTAPPELKALVDLGVFANSVGYYYAVKKPDPATAEKYLHATFSLGAKLYAERLTYDEMADGLKLMSTATASLKALEKNRGDAARQQALQRFDNETTAYHKTQVQPLYEKVVSVGGADIRRHAGDVFALAMSSPERMWRTEALLKVGRMKFEKGGTASDQIWARRLLTEPQRLGQPDPAQDPDPAVRHAAILARDLGSLGEISY